MCAQGLADAWPLSVAKHVDKTQVGRNELLERAVGRQRFNDAAPVAKSLAGARQADASLVHAQDLGAQDDLVLIDEPLGLGRPQELAHLDGSRLAIFLALPAEPRSCEPSRGRRERASRDPAEQS